MTQASLRLPDSLWKRAEQLAAAMTEADPSTEYSRTDAIRRLLETHLPPLRQQSDEPSGAQEGSEAGVKPAPVKRGAAKR